MSTAEVVIIGSVLGLLVGSFLNVVVHRLPLDQSVVRPGSRCPGCLTSLRAIDNLPIVSWLILRGRCRTCGVGISPRYPLVEAATAGLFALIAAEIGAHADLPAFLTAATGLLALSLIDIDTKRLPDLVLLPTLAGTAALLTIAAAVDDRWDDLGRAAAGAVLGFASLLAIHLARPRGLGFGDVKLALICGLTLGWLGITEVLIGLYGGFVLGAVIGVSLIAVGRAEFGRSIPFGPFLAAGTLLTVLLGDPLADALRDWWP